MKVSFKFNDNTVDFSLESMTNDKGLIPWWLIAVTAPVPGVTLPAILFNMAVLGKRQLTE